MLALVIVIFLALVFPYIATSKRVFGSYFYNVNSTYYFWCDSWEEAKAFSRASGDRVGLPKLPPEQVPSAAKYWREHSIGDIASRLLGGVIGRLTHNARLDGYWKYGVLLALMVAGLAFYRREQFVELVRARFFLALFLFLFFGSYLALFAWYERIANDARFLLLLFLPFTFAAWRLIVRLGDGIMLTLGNARVSMLSAFACLLLAVAAAEAVLNAVRLMNRVPGGVARLFVDEQAAYPFVGSIKPNSPSLRR
jgi:hypothetical protein